MRPAEIDEEAIDDRETQMDERDECPGCGRYYTITVSAPPMPMALAEHGTDQQMEDWDREHQYNVATCSVCGWREDE